MKEGDIIAVKVWVEQADLLPSDEDQDESDVVLEYELSVGNSFPLLKTLFVI